MSEDHRTEYPAGVPCWVDQMPADARGAADFYAGLFGWAAEDGLPDEVPGHYFVASIDGGAVGGIGSAPDESGPMGWTSYVRVVDVAASAAAAPDAGGTVLQDPFDVGPAGTMAMIADPAGAVFSLWQPGARLGAEVVNSHGAWNFSGLHTDDLAAADLFYGALFGWERSPFDPSQPDGPGYYRLPAYGDHLEARTPGTRAQMREMGAPDRFEESVAQVTPLADGCTPHWDVTFGTDDADATVARARELGATVVQDVVDGPWTREAIIEDPGGHRFVVSQFTPPT